MKRRQFIKSTTAVGIVTVITPSGILYSCRRKDRGSLENSFRTPPAYSRPFTWWHWLNGNVTREGITRDLEELKDKGYRGATAFSIGHPIFSRYAKGPVDYNSPEWHCPIVWMRYCGQSPGRGWHLPRPRPPRPWLCLFPVAFA